MSDPEFRLGETELGQAVARGIITAGQAAALRQLADEAPAAAMDADEEHFRLLGGFNDIFVAIGLTILIAALITAAGLGSDRRWIPVASLIIAWGLAEIFTRRLQLALPSIILAGMFAVSAALSAAIVFRPESGGAVTAAVLAIVFGGAAQLHFRRFQVPVDVSFVAAGIAGAALVLLRTLAPGPFDDFLPALTLLVGIGIFLLAMRFDLRDPQRRTRSADIAFWLHLLAAPVIVHSLIAGLFGSGKAYGLLWLQMLSRSPGLLPGLGETARAVVILGIVLGLLAVALLIDRRALLVSGLTYAGFALWVLVGGNVGRALTLPLTLFLLAAAVLTVSAGWPRLRAAFVSRLPGGSFIDRLPPVRRAVSGVKLPS